MVWQPKTPETLTHDVPTRNVIEVPPPSISQAAATPSPIPVTRSFVPPPKSEPTPVPNAPTLVAPDAPAIQEGLSAMSAVPLASRTFVPPPPEASTRGSGDTGLQAPPSLGAGALSQSQSPVAVVGLDAPNRSMPLPPGSREAQFSTGPVSGTGPAGGNGVHVPGLTIHGVNGAEAGSSGTTRTAVATPTREILYRDVSGTSGIQSISAPLRAGARRIPAMIENHFAGRNVYVLALAAPRLPCYSGEWVLWFGERNEKSFESPRIRAPLPFRKREIVGEQLAGGSVTTRAVLSIVISANGTVESVKPLEGVTAETERRITGEVQSWQFLPALRDGVAIPVDAIVAIPFRLAP